MKCQPANRYEVAIHREARKQYTIYRERHLFQRFHPVYAIIDPVGLLVGPSVAILYLTNIPEERPWHIDALVHSENFRKIPFSQPLSLSISRTLPRIVYSRPPWLKTVTMGSYS